LAGARDGEGSGRRGKGEGERREKFTIKPYL